MGTLSIISISVSIPKVQHDVLLASHAKVLGNEHAISHWPLPPWQRKLCFQLCWFVCQFVSNTMQNVMTGLQC